jgi:hypothetical protein
LPFSFSSQKIKIVNPLDYKVFRWIAKKMKLEAIHELPLQEKEKDLEVKNYNSIALEESSTLLIFPLASKVYYNYILRNL